MFPILRRKRQPLVLPNLARHLRAPTPGLILHANCNRLSCEYRIIEEVDSLATPNNPIAVDETSELYGEALFPRGRGLVSHAPLDSEVQYISGAVCLLGAGTRMAVPLHQIGRINYQVGPVGCDEPVRQHLVRNRTDVVCVRGGYGTGGGDPPIRGHVQRSVIHAKEPEAGPLKGEWIFGTSFQTGSYVNLVGSIVRRRGKQVTFEEILPKS